MPHVQPKSKVPRQGMHNRADIGKIHPESKPRDDLRTAYAGDKNAYSSKGTNVKARRLRKGDMKEPVR